MWREQIQGLSKETRNMRSQTGCVVECLYSFRMDATAPDSREGDGNLQRGECEEVTRECPSPEHSVRYRRGQRKNRWNQRWDFSREDSQSSEKVNITQ